MPTHSRSGLSSSRHIPKPELDALNAAYGGKRCILTRAVAANDWAHIIPHAHDITFQDRQISNIKLLNLVSENFTAVSQENLLPIAPALHTLFDAYTWTVYPTRETLLHLIKHEELQLVRRSLAIAAGRDDPGRPSYEEFYGTLEYPISYEVHFAADFPEIGVANYQDQSFYWVRPEDGRQIIPFPTLSLICNVNVVVMMRTAVLARPMLTWASEVLMLGSYLITLWTADPKQVQRHFALRPVFIPPFFNNDFFRTPSITNSPSHTSSLSSLPPNQSNTHSPSKYSTRSTSHHHHTIFNSSTTYKEFGDTKLSRKLQTAISTPPPSRPSLSPPLRATLSATLEVRHTVALHWYRIIYPTLLGEDVVPPPLFPGKSKGLSANETARLCGVKLARTWTPDSLRYPASTLNNTEEGLVHNFSELDKERAEKIEAWKVIVSKTSQLDPNA